MKVDIYITTCWHGNFAKGSGGYGIALCLADGKRQGVKEHYAGWDSLPYQKLAVRAAADAIQYMTAPCDVVIHTDNPYVEGTVNSGKPGGKYAVLWETFFEAAGRMQSVKAVREKHHEYTMRLRQGLAQGNYITMEDR